MEKLMIPEICWRQSRLPFEVDVVVVVVAVAIAPEKKNEKKCVVKMRTT